MCDSSLVLFRTAWEAKLGQSVCEYMHGYMLVCVCMHACLLGLALGCECMCGYMHACVLSCMTAILFCMYASRHADFHHKYTCQSCSFDACDVNGGTHGVVCRTQQKVCAGLLDSSCC